MGTNAIKFIVLMHCDARTSAGIKILFGNCSEVESFIMYTMEGGTD